jgi:hypothetical protein
MLTVDELDGKKIGFGSLTFYNQHKQQCKHWQGEW